MSGHYEKHANEVVNAFVNLLDDGAKAALTDEYRNELAMLVEASISTAVFDQVDRAATEVQELATKIRGSTKHLGDRA